MNEQQQNSPELLERRIWQLMKSGKLDEAAAACDQLTQSFPDYGSGWNTSSRLAIALNEPIIALRAVQQALLLSPGKPEWLVQKMASLAVYGDLEAADVIANELAEHEFDTAYHASTCAVTMNRLERFADAERHCARAVQLNPNNPTYHFNLATAQRYQGKSEEAGRNLDRAIELNPVNGEAQLLRSGFKASSESDNNIESIRSALDQVSDDHPSKAQLGYALSKELDDIGRYPESFEALRQAAALHRSKLSYRLQDDLDAMRTIREHFNAEIFAANGEGFVNAEPIFLIGMPRSGTALVQNVLNNHPVVRPVGEAQMFGVELVNQCQTERGFTPANTEELINAAVHVDFTALGESYYRSARPLTSLHAHLVDRLPENFMYAGLIHLALPKAKIILVEREPMDNCYAAYKTIFPGAYPYTYDLNELAQYFVGYSKLIAHWRQVMPNAIYCVQYEDLVQNPRATIEDLLQHCSLSFEESCLTYFHIPDSQNPTNARQLRHRARVRQVGHWQHYGQELAPVAKMLRASNII